MSEGATDGERAGRIEATFREANEGIAATAARLGATGQVPFICECEDTRCTAIVLLELDEYAAIRRHPRRFLVREGHDPAVRVVGAGEKHAVVEKDGRAGEVAEELAP